MIKIYIAYYFLLLLKLIEFFYSRLRHEDYNTITAKIVTLFSKEAAQVYYIPSVKKRDSFSGHSIVARGKLVDKARNLICKSETTAITRKRKVSSNQCEDDMPEKKLNIGNVSILKLHFYYSLNRHFF